MTSCPECDAAVDVVSPVPGEIFPCRDCGTELEVTDRAVDRGRPGPEGGGRLG